MALTCHWHSSDSFVLIQTVVDSELRFAVLEYVSKVQIGGRIVNRIAAEDD